MLFGRVLEHSGCGWVLGVNGKVEWWVWDLGEGLGWVILMVMFGLVGNENGWINFGGG